MKSIILLIALASIATAQDKTTYEIKTVSDLQTAIRDLPKTAKVTNRCDESGFLIITKKRRIFLHIPPR